MRVLAGRRFETRMTSFIWFQYATFEAGITQRRTTSRSSLPTEDGILPSFSRKLLTRPLSLPRRPLLHRSPQTSTLSRKPSSYHRRFCHTPLDGRRSSTSRRTGPISVQQEPVAGGNREFCSGIALKAGSERLWEI